MKPNRTLLSTPIKLIKQQSITAAFLLILTAFLTGCGGQKEQAAEEPPPPPAPVEVIVEEPEMVEVPREAMPAPPEAMPAEAAPDDAGSEPPAAVFMEKSQPEAAAPEGGLLDEESSKDFHTVEVYYGTDREPTGVETPNGQYGKGRNREGPMEYGITTVTIPKHHKIGVVERPKWYKLEFSENPKKHVTIKSVEKMEGDPFFAKVNDTASGKPKNEALLFVHGFNVEFDEAIRRTGQIAFDLDFGGVALSYSWPSQGSLGAYTIDKSNAEWSIPHLTQFLMDLQEKTDFEKIHIIAHSMGTRVLTYALANAKDEGFKLELNNVILAAPDIDVDIFTEQILPKIAGVSKNLTMYASSDDAALKVSRKINGSSRLGLSGEGLVVTPGMDTINASGIDTSMIGHGYYGSHKVIVTDILGLVIKGLDPPHRKLILGNFGEWDFADLTE